MRFIVAWQNAPWNLVTLIVWMDGNCFKVRESSSHQQDRFYICQ